MPDVPTDSLIPKSLESVSYLREEMIKTMEGVSKIAERGSINFLQSLGGGLLVIAFLLKLVSSRLWLAAGASASPSALSTAEFITVVLVSMVLILAGSAMRLYQFQKEQEAATRVRDSGVELVSKAMDAGKGLSEYQPPKSQPL
jgi:hypothetical protein